MRTSFGLFVLVASLSLAIGAGAMVKSKPDASTIVTLTGGQPSPLKASLRAERGSSICWQGEDAEYVIRFESSQWEFQEAPDWDDKNGDRIIQVPKGGCSRSFSLDYELKPGMKREHHYRVAEPGEVGPTNGPVVIGEG